MASLNKVFLMGNLTRDPELRYTPKGAAVAQFAIAVNRRFSVEGEQREEVTYVDIVAWAKTAEVINEYLKKGSPIFIEGRLKLDQWDDKTTGQKRSRLQVIVESFQFINGKAPEEGAAGAPANRTARPRVRPETTPDAAGGTANDGPPTDDDDVPF